MVAYMLGGLCPLRDGMRMPLLLANIPLYSTLLPLAIRDILPTFPLGFSVHILSCPERGILHTPHHGRTRTGGHFPAWFSLGTK